MNVLKGLAPKVRLSRGFNIIKLNVGEPSANVPKAAEKAAIASLKKHQTHYTAPCGDLSLREEIAFYLEKTRNVEFIASDIVVTPGTKPVIPGTIFLLVNPGDEVIYPLPCYPIYESIINFVGAKGVPVLLREENGFRLDIAELAKKISRKTKLLILNSPSNPTGGILTKKDYDQIAQLAVKHNFFIFVDE